MYNITKHSSTATKKQVIPKRLTLALAAGERKDRRVFLFRTYVHM